MTGMREQAQKELREAEEAAELARRRLKAMEEPRIAIAARLHEVLHRQFCEPPGSGTNGLCFNPTTVPLAPGQLADGWTVGADIIFRRFTTMADHMLDAGVPVDQVLKLVEAMATGYEEAKRLGW